MLIIWCFLAALFLFVTQRLLFLDYWDRGLHSAIYFDVAAITEGESVTLTERFENRKLLPLPYFIYRYCITRNYASVLEPGGAEAEVRRRIALPIRRSVRCKTKVDSLPRGVYGLAPIFIGATDLLHTANMQQELHSRAHLTVYPRKIPVQRMQLPCQQLLGAVLTRRYAQEDPFQLKGIRPYEIYDSLRDINWKASARSGELKVNQHEFTTDEALLILLDLSSGSDAQREKLISLASSLSQVFLRRGITVALMSNLRSCVTGGPTRVMPGGSLRQQTVVDTALAQIKLSTDPDGDFAAFLRTVPPALLRGSVSVVLSADPTEAPMLAYRAMLGGTEGFLISVAAEQPEPMPGVTILPWEEQEGGQL